MQKFLIPLVVMGSVTAAAANPTNVDVRDRYTEVSESVPYTRLDCVSVDVPIYGRTYEEGNAAEGALLGMLLGGLAGKGATGDDGGAAAGAVIGGLIGADRGSRPRVSQGIIGYESQEKCTDVTYYEDVKRTVYSHSVITFNYDGTFYSLPFDK